MIARLWHGKVANEKAAAYHEYLLATGLKDYRLVPGNRSVNLLKRQDGAVTHYYTLTYWNDIESIRQFAGEDYEKARYYPEDKNYLLELENKVVHFEVLEHIEGGSQGSMG